MQNTKQSTPRRQNGVFRDAPKECVMLKRYTKRFVGLLFALLSGMMVMASGSELAGSTPNIVFILADDMGLGDIKAYGGDKCKIDTPHADRLAANGMKFLDAHTSSSVCTPSRYGLLTGRYCWRTKKQGGVLHGYNKALIAPSVPTVASFLKENGYQTACIGKWHLGLNFDSTVGNKRHEYNALEAKWRKGENVDIDFDWSAPIKGGPVAVGFDYFLGISASLDMSPYVWIENDHFIGTGSVIKRQNGRPGPAHPDFKAVEVLAKTTEKTVEYIDRAAKSEKPFFVYMSLNSPHSPLVPSAEFLGKSAVGPFGDFMMETDWSVGQVVAALERNGIVENTIIIYSADNGCSVSAQRKGPNSNTKIIFQTGDGQAIEQDAHYPSDIYRGHKTHLYEGGHRVPFIVRWDKKIAPGSNCDRMVGLTDFLATCADIIGKPVPPQVSDSISFLPYLLGETPDATVARKDIIHHSFKGRFSIRQGDWKLLLDPDPNSDLPKDSRPGIQLYNLASDPGESKNVQAAHPEMTESLVALLETQVQSGRSNPGAPLSNDDEVDIWKRPKQRKK